MFSSCLTLDSTCAAIFQTCKEMYHADSEEKRRKSLLSNTTCLETITEGRQQRTTATESQQLKVMKSKGVQVSRNFEDSLRRYHPTPQRSEFREIQRFISRLKRKPISFSSSQHLHNLQLKAFHAPRKYHPCRRLQVEPNDLQRKAVNLQLQQPSHRQSHLQARDVRM